MHRHNLCAPAVWRCSAVWVGAGRAVRRGGEAASADAFELALGCYCRSAELLGLRAVSTTDHYNFKVRLPRSCAGAISHYRTITTPPPIRAG